MLRKTFALALLLAGVGCGGNGGKAADAGNPVDADPNAPDADPNAPDANPADPDAATPECSSAPVSGIPTLTTEIVASGFAKPVAAVVPPGDTRIFVVENPGIVSYVENGERVEPPFLDIQNVVNDNANERGLLGLAFHPQYQTNKRFYVYYTANTTGALILAEYTASSANDANEASAKILLTIPHPDAPNHNGGWLGFGPDGYLYMATGDGGGGGDGPGNAQNENSLLGKMLRLDVNTAGVYSSPSTNPFVDKNGADEIWAYGLRNPWRNWFDSTGDLYIADVGQDFMEEVNVQPKNAPGGRNYGWDIMEGTSCFNDMNFTDPLDTCDMDEKVLPVHVYQHSGGQSITGGPVYRGCKMPDLHGTYFYGDVVDGFIKSFKWDGAASVTDKKDYPQFNGIQAYGFGVDAEGEVLIVDGDTENLFRIIPE